MKLGPYEVKSELGRGSGGVVYHVVGPDGRELALKVLPRSLGRDRARLVRELELMRSLGENSGFVALLDAGTAPEGAYLVMPLLRGGTLRERIARGAFTPFEVAELGITLASTVGRAHVRHIVHRDLKPENVLFDTAGAAFVADLGVAKLLLGDSTPLGDLSRTGEVRGTPGYMPLEQLKDAKRAGPPADVFAIGAILYECLVGRPPFLRDTLVSTVDALEAGSLEPIARSRPDVPRPLANAIERALSADPEKRFPDGAAFAHALEDAVAAGERGRPVALLALAAVGAVALAVVVGFLLRGNASGPRPSPAPTTSGSPSAGVASPNPARTGGPGPARSPTPAVTPSPTPSPSPAPAGSRLELRGLLGSAAFRHGGRPTALDVARDESFAVVGDDEGGLRWWSLPSGEELHAHALGGARIQALAVLADGRRTLVLYQGHEPLVVNPATGANTTLSGHEAEVVACAAAPTGAIVATGDKKGTVRIWDMDARKLVLSITGETPVRALAFGPDGNHVFVGTENGFVIEIQREPKAQLPNVLELKAPIVALAVSPEGDRVAAATDEGFARIVHRPDGALAQLLSFPHVRSLSFGAGGRIYAVNEAGDLGTWELASDRPGITGDGAVRGGGRVAGLPALGRAIFLSAPVGEPRVTGSGAPPGHERWVAAILPLPGGRLATAGGDHAVRIWDLATGRELEAFREHQEGLTSLALDPASGAILSAGFDGVVHERDPATGRSRARADSVAGKRVEAVRVATDGRAWIATDKGIAPTLANAAVAAPSGTHVLALEPAPEGRLLAWELSGQLSLRDERTNDTEWSRKLEPPATRTALGLVPGGLAITLEASGRLRLLRVADGSDVWPAPVSVPRSRAVAASPDGRRLAVGGSLGVLLLDAADGGVLAASPIPSHIDAVTSVAFASDGRELLAGTERGLIVRYAVTGE